MISLYDELEVINTEPPKKIITDKRQKIVLSLDWSWATRSQADLPSAPYSNNCLTVTLQIQPTGGNPVLNFHFVKVFAAKSWKQRFILET